MRYSLHNALGHRIGEAETAAEIGSMAQDGTFSYDTMKGTVYPCVAWRREAVGMVGTPFKYRFEAMEWCRKVGSAQ